MNNIFSFGRFWKYFLHDLENARNYFLLSGIIIGLVPVLTYIIFELFNILALGHWQAGSIAVQLISFSLVIVLGAYIFPAKAYGSITDTGAGSSWLMIPASTFEKWLSMMLICLVVLPLFLSVLCFGSDALLSALVPNYGRSMMFYAMESDSFVRDYIGDGIELNLPLMVYCEWVESILPFLLGAVLFKRAKVAKTFLALMAFGMVATPLFFLIIGTTSISSDMIESMLNSASVLQITHKVNIAFSAYYILFAALLMALTYLRLKTIKH